MNIYLLTADKEYDYKTFQLCLICQQKTEARISNPRQRGI